MSDNNKRLAFAALLYVGLCALVLIAPRLAVQQPDSVINVAARERIAINAKEDCYLYNGADLIAYSDDHTTAKIYLMGNTGNVGIGGNLVVTGSLTAAAGGGAVGVWTLNATDAVTVGGTLDVVGALEVTGTSTFHGAHSWDSYLSAGNGLLVANNLTGTSAAGNLRYASGMFTTTLSSNTISVTDNITAGGGVDIVGALEVTGTADLRGVVSSSSNDFRLNDNALISGTVTASGVISTPASIYIADNLTGDSTDGVLRYARGYITTTLDTQSISVTTGITGATLHTSGIAYLNQSIVTSTLSANSISTTDAITAGGTLRSVGVAYLEQGIVTSTLSANTLSTTDAITAGGTLRSVGVAYLQSGVVTSTLSANSISATTAITAANLTASTSAALQAASVTTTLSSYTISASQNITASGSLTVTGFVGLGGTYMAVSSTVDYTDTETLIVVVNKTIYPVTAGGPTATLNDTTSISDGLYLGQIIVISNMDNVATHLIVIKDNANTDIGADLTLDSDKSSGPKTAWFWWNLTDWVYMGNGT